MNYYGFPPGYNPDPPAADIPAHIKARARQQGATHLARDGQHRVQHSLRGLLGGRSAPVQPSSEFRRWLFCRRSGIAHGRCDQASYYVGLIALAIKPSQLLGLNPDRYPFGVGQFGLTAGRWARAGRFAFGGIVVPRHYHFTSMTLSGLAT